MPGDVIGYSCSCEIILNSRSPLDPEVTTSPEAIARALTEQLMELSFMVGREKEPHRVAEVHVYRVAPTLSAVRAALDQPTPWTGQAKKAPRSKRKRS